MGLTELCQDLRNWFCADSDIHVGTFEVKNGTLSLPFLLKGQYFRVVGSVFNDGVHKYGDGGLLQDEAFTGAIWAMKIPLSFIEMANEISEWIASHPDTGLASESYDGYSYSRPVGASGAPIGWKEVFASRLNAWRKL